MDDLPRTSNWSPRPIQPAAGAPALPIDATDLRISFADIRSIIGVMLRHWKMMTLAPIITIALAIAVLSLIAPQYKSTVQVLVADPRQPTNAANDQSLSSLDVDAAAVASEVEVMRSRSILLATARKLGLDKDSEFTARATWFQMLQKLGLVRGRTPEADSSVTAAVGTADPDVVTPSLDRAVNTLQQRLTVERVQFSYVISESVLSESPDKARQIAAALADTYLNSRLEARYDSEQRATTWLSGRLDELRQRVASGDAAIAKLKADAGLSDTGRDTNLNQQQISDLNGQLILARADAAEKRARYDQISRATAGGGNLEAIPEVIASPVIGQLRVQQATLSQHLAELQSHLSDRYPDVINAKSQLADVSRQISAEVGRIVGNVKNQLDVANQRVASLQQSLATMTAQNGSSQALGKLQELQRVSDSNRKLYESFLNQYNSIDQRLTLSDTGARIISPAAIPAEAAYPRQILITILAGIAGMMLGIVLAFLVEYLDSGFKTGLQVEQTLHLPVLGLVRKVGARKWRSHAVRGDILKSVIDEPFGQVTESVRSIRMGIAMSDVDHPPRVILVTSSIPDEGKTTMSMMLAASSALSQQRTILIDCDLRRESVSAVFGLRDKPGVVDVLTERVSLKDAIVHDNTSLFSVLPSGKATANIVDLLSSQRMADMIGQLRKQFDCIILDGSPLLPVVDSLVVSRLADKIALVVEWSRTPRATVIDAVKLLNRESGKISGIVLNKADFRRLKSYGYGYGYGYNYGKTYKSIGKYYHES